MGPTMCTFSCVEGTNERTVANPAIIGGTEVTWQNKDCDDGNLINDDGCTENC